MSATQEDEIHRLKTDNTSLQERIVNLEFREKDLLRLRDKLRKENAELVAELHEAIAAARQT